MHIDATRGPFSRLSLFSLHLDLFVNSEFRGSGTGFIYLSKTGNLYLVTNYHVITARLPNKPDDPLPGWPDQPDEVVFRILARQDMKFISCSIAVADVPHLEHPRRKEGVDLIALPITPPQDSQFLTQNNLDLVEDIEITLGGDLFIIGYPFGLGAGDFLPIWKRGTIASEPNFWPRGLNMFYIDASTKSGMSGSPVFAAESRQFLETNKQISQAFLEWERGERDPMDVIEMIGKNDCDDVVKRMMSFVGVYSGRITVPSGEDTQIGIVWKRELLEELFERI